MERLVEVFRAFGDMTRLKIVKLLTAREMCVSEMVEATGLAQPSVSQHLAKLRSARLVRERREGQLVFYSIIEENLLEFERACRTFLDADLCGIPEMSRECERLRAAEREGRPSCLRGRPSRGRAPEGRAGPRTTADSQSTRNGKRRSS